MNRRQKIWLMLEKLSKELRLPDNACSGIGFTAEEIGQAAGVSRSNASLELNKLVRTGHAVKYTGRPVRFISRQLWKNLRDKGDTALPESAGAASPDPFQQLIGCQQSLRSQIEQAKAAIKYPPQGLPCLINGATGTGKTLFAQTMFHYARHSGIIDKDARLALFNCADYAHNPQLLMSQLFGHAKGAFTGALQERTGLIDTAHRSMLFLDEIHRLPPEGQEMLFYLMDHNRYSRLGESGNDRYCSTLVVGATTENPQSALLHTFLRRFPVIVELPSLAARPISERTLLLRHILQEESRKMNVTINVHPIAVQQFLLYYCPGNIGQLINDVRLACAKALFHAPSRPRLVVITPELLGPYVRSAQASNQLRLVAASAMEEDWSFSAVSQIIDWLDSLAAILAKLQPIGNWDWKKSGVFRRELDELLQSLTTGQDKSFQALRRQVLRTAGADTIKAAHKAQEMLAKACGPSSQPILLALAMHLQAMKENHQRRSTGLHWQSLWDQYPEAAAAARQTGLLLTKELGITPLDDDIGFWVLLQLAYQSNIHPPPPGIVIIAHGTATATSLAAVANHKVCKPVVLALDIPLAGNENQIDAAKELVSQADRGGGVLLLVDMEPFVFWGEIIARATEKKVRTIENVSTAMAVSAARKALLPGISLDDLADSLLVEWQVRFSPQYSVTPGKNPVIAATCLTGQGAAFRIKSMLLDWLGDKRDIEIISVNASGQIIGSNAQLEALAEEKRLLAVVGSVDPGLDTVPFISLEELMSRSGWKRLEKMVDLQVPVSPLPTEGLEALLRQYLRFLDAAKMVKLCSEFFETVRHMLDRPLLTHQAITLTVHLSCMAERVMSGEYAAIPADETIRQSHPAEWQAVTAALSLLEKKLHIAIPPSETAFIVQFLTGNR